MKFIFLLLLSSFSSVGFSQTSQPPLVSLNQDVLGGNVLLIKMKAYLVISGTESQSLEKELGTEIKKMFLSDIVMSKSPMDLMASYNSQGDKLMVQTILNRYFDILEKINSSLKLN